MINAEGESVTYSWEDATPPANPGKPAGACIQVINTRSRFKPFAILRPHDRPAFDIYAGEVRRNVSLYPWWNHWPAATFPSDGRFAMAADRPSHSSLTHLKWDAYRTGPQSMTKIMLTGLSDEPASDLLRLLHSWSRPPRLEMRVPGTTQPYYDPTEKAYLLERPEDPDAPIDFRLHATADSPVVNPAFLVHNWGEGPATVRLNGAVLKPGPRCRIGARRTLEGSDLIVWVRHEGTVPVTIEIEHGDRRGRRLSNDDGD
jgi:hypothetical protein